MFLKWRDLQPRRHPRGGVCVSAIRHSLAAVLLCLPLLGILAPETAAQSAPTQKVEVTDATEGQSITVTAALMLVAVKAEAGGPDATAPELDKAEVNGASLVLTYNEALDGNSVPTVGAYPVTDNDGSDPADGGSAPATDTFMVAVDSGVGPAVTSVAIIGSEVRLTLAAAVACRTPVAVSYSVPSLNPVRDAAGNDVVALSDHAVTNTTQCSIIGSEVGLTLASAAAVALVAASVDDSSPRTSGNASIAWSGSFTETPANDGTVSGTVTATLTGAIFTPNVVSGSHVTASNVPAGLTASFARASATVVTLTLTGSATRHANADDVSDLTVAFADDAFTNKTATRVARSSKADIVVDFNNPPVPPDASIAWSGSFTETPANDGTVSGTVTATLTGAIFTPNVVSGSHVTASNVPAGLTASFARASATVVTLTLTGSATRHANADDVSDLTVAFTDDAFTNADDASHLTVAFADDAFTNKTATRVARSSKADIVVDFNNPPVPPDASIAWSGSFTETPANDGTVSGTVTATLTGAIFTPNVVSGSHVTASNVPAGLTVSFARASATVVTLTLTGSATRHANADNVSDLTVAFADDAFTNKMATRVARSSKADIVVDFNDPPPPVPPDSNTTKSDIVNDFLAHPG